jgi:hypothetical protein
MRHGGSAVVVTAAIFVLFHFFAVVLPILSSGGSGESQAFATLLFDAPIWWLVDLFPAGRKLAYSSHAFYVLVSCVGGTLMYAAFGALVGLGMRTIIRAIRAA